MKLHNLVELYKVEKIKKEKEEEKERYLKEREIKGALERGANVVQTMQVKSELGSEELRTKTIQSTKRVKQIAKTGPSKRRKVTQVVPERVEKDKPESAQAKDKPESAKAPQDQLSQSTETS